MHIHKKLHQNIICEGHLLPADLPQISPSFAIHEEECYYPTALAGCMLLDAFVTHLGN